MDTGTSQPHVTHMSHDTDGGVDPKTGMVESDFITTLRQTLMGQDKNLWPPDKLIDEPEKALKQVTAMFRALFMRVERRKALPAAPENSALGIVSKMLKKSKWPNEKDKKFPVPAAYKDDEVLAFRRYEVTCAMALFYQSFHGAGGGGVPTDWPPKNP